jgi:RNA-dependent RNA polymerase
MDEEQQDIFKSGTMTDNDNSQIIEGPVIVTKNPCSHPGDIRLLRAIGKSDPRVNQYKLMNDFVNIIVFPSKGKRPE